MVPVLDTAPVKMQQYESKLIKGCIDQVYLYDEKGVLQGRVEKCVHIEGSNRGAQQEGLRRHAIFLWPLRLDINKRLLGLIHPHEDLNLNHKRT